MATAHTNSLIKPQPKTPIDLVNDAYKADAINKIMQKLSSMDNMLRNMQQQMDDMQNRKYRLEVEE